MHVKLSNNKELSEQACLLLCLLYATIKHKLSDKFQKM
jgi:hypothetical protein